MKRRLPTTNQSGSLLATNSLPPVTSAANGHSAGNIGPAREQTAANADAIAPSARPTGSTLNAGAKPDSSTTTAEKAAANIAARRAKRRTQPRAVV